MVATTAKLGILMLDNHFERFVGDLGNPETFQFPVLYKRVAGATTEAITTINDDRFLQPFVDAALELVARGIDGIVTSCGFLAIYQTSFADRLPVPVASSALLQVPMVQRLLPAGRRVGVITFNEDSLGASHFAGVGADPATPVAGLARDGNFRRALLGQPCVDGFGVREREAVEAARRLVAQHSSIGAIVLECTNLVPHAEAISAAVGLPIYDVMTLVTWFYAGLRPRRWDREAAHC